ncbi:MAG: CHAT domain-containing protein [Intrasporangium sp.]|uniref:CHAT domain-containing protein n=1 Tax=Intrasporangium sp. TaxID=1925024 RepID=UPI0026499EDD|nr:CHAT domain-containing protein [Intrasporangium sp.]MDN5794979.1 CHAT domain-containing protein [Intrasporangium sp.]
MEHDYLDFDVALVPEGGALGAHVVASPAGAARGPFVLPFSAVDLARFINTVGPPNVTTRRLVPATTRVLEVEDYGRRLGDALLTGEVDRLFRESLSIAKGQGRDLRLRLRLEQAPDLEAVPWEYLYDGQLGRFLTLSRQTPLIRVLDALDVPPAVPVVAPMRILVMVSSPSDLPPLDVEREKQLLLATTGDLVQSGRLEIEIIADATLTALQRALLDPYHIFHFIGHGGFDRDGEEGVLALEREDGMADHVAGGRLATLLHDAPYLQLAVLNACEGARTSGHNAFDGVAQMLVRQGLPAVVAMRTAISDRAALVFSHEFYYFLSRGLPIDAAICEVRKAMATSDQAAEWGTPVLLRSGSAQPFDMAAPDAASEPARESRWESLYTAAQAALGSQSTDTALPMLEQLAAEKPDYADVTQLLERVHQSQSSVQQSQSSVQQSPSSVQQSPSSVQQSPSSVQQSPSSVQPMASPQTLVSQPPARPPSAGRADERRSGLGRGAMIGAGALVLALAGGYLGWRLLSGDGTTENPTIENSVAATPVRTPPIIDGAFADWASTPAIAIDNVVAQTSGSDGSPAVGTWRTAWDASALYVQATVGDGDLAVVDRKQPSAYWQGDGISFEFGPDTRSLDASAGLRAGKDIHVMIGLGSRGGLPSTNPARVDQTGQVSFLAGNAERRIATAAGLTRDGYAIEARIPWTVLHVTTPPQPGTVFGFNANISDANRTGSNLGSMVSSNPDRSGRNQPHPGTWQRLVLNGSES